MKVVASPFFSFLFLSQLLFSFFVVTPLFSLEIPPEPHSYVNDYAGLLDLNSRQQLEVQLRTFEKYSSHQIVIAIFPSLDGEVLEDFSQRLAERWRVGQKIKNNGVLLLVSLKERAVRIEVGYGLESVLSDALSKRIIQNEIIPNFREEHYDEGLFAAVKAIQSAIQGEYQGNEKKNTSKPFSVLGLIFFLIIFGFLSRMSRRRGITFFPGTWGGGGGWSSGGGGFSGGGGSFGGGGASGRW